MALDLQLNPLVIPLQPCTYLRQLPTFQSHALIHLPVLFNQDIRPDLIHSVLCWQLNRQRRGTASTKTRWEVHGSNRKILPQKGSGKARMGDIRNPMRVGGGRVFGPKPRNFETKLPLRTRKLAKCAVLAAKHAQNQCHLFQSHQHTNQIPNKKDFVKSCQYLHWKECAIVVTKLESMHWYSQLKDLSNVYIMACEMINIHRILSCDQLLLSTKALEYLQLKLQVS